MGLKKRIKSISRITRELLAEGESLRVDFKRQPSGISAEDLVAFANSDDGGNILAGVDEQSVGDAEVGVVCGCNVSDATILQVLNKAVGCIPPVSVDIYIENLAKKPILRIEVLPSTTRPHCTPKGIYCRRDGARNRPLHPSELLKLFLDAEASVFAARFEVAADRITEELGTLEASLDRSIQSMSDQLGWADSHLVDTEGALDSIQGIVSNIFKDVNDTSTRIRVLFRQDKREDPIKEREKLKFVNMLIAQIQDDESLLSHILDGGGLVYRLDNNDKYSDITKEDANRLLKIAANHVRKKHIDKEYKLLVGPAKNFSADELDQFAAIVAEGGEVADGVHARVKRAYRLGFIVYEGRVVGTAALKKPRITYRAKVFTKAKSELAPKDYPYELGWIFLDALHRNKGQMTRLLMKLEPETNGAAIFATTRTSNEVMRTLLSHFGFEQDGCEYASELHKNESLELFVRKARPSQADDVV
jgi:cytidylate kinase